MRGRSLSADGWEKGSPTKMGELKSGARMAKSAVGEE
jgi:hypothetical protein